METNLKCECGHREREHNSTGCEYTSCSCKNFVKLERAPVVENEDISSSEVFLEKFSGIKINPISEHIDLKKSEKSQKIEHGGKKWDIQEKLTSQIEELVNEGKIDEALEKHDELLKTGDSFTKIENWLRRAYLLLSKENTEEAKLIFKNILMVDEKNYRASFELASLERQENNFEKATEYLKIAEQIRGSSDEISYEYGMLSIDKEEFEKAINYLSSVSSQSNFYPDSLSNIGFCYQELKEYDEAIEKFFDSERLRKSQDDVWNRNHIAYCYYRQEKYDESIKYIEQNISNSLRNNYTFKILSWCYYEKRQFVDFFENCYLASNLGETTDFFKMGYAFSQLKNSELSKYYYLESLKISQDEVTFNNLGSVYKDLREYDNAIKMFKNALDINPKYHLALRNLANVYFKQEKFDEAIECFNKILNDEPNDSNALSNLANAYCNAQKYDKALDVVEDAIKNNPDESYNFRVKGDIFFEQDKFLEALESFEKASEKDPDDIKMHIRIARCHDYLDNEKELVTKIDFILEKDPEDVYANYMKCDFLINDEKYDEALVIASKILKLDNQSYKNWSLKAKVLHFMGYYDESILYYKKSLELKPNLPITVVNLSKAMFNIGLKDQAIYKINKCLKSNPGNLELLEWKVEIFEIENELDNVLETYEEIYKVRPDDPKTENNLGWILAKLDRFDEAMSFVEKSLEHQTNSDSDLYFATLHSKAYILMNTGDFKQAREILVKVTDNRSRPVYYCDYAVVLRRLDKEDEAITILNKAKKEFPDEARIYHEIGDAQYNKREYLDSWKNYFKAIELDPHNADYYTDVCWISRDRQKFIVPFIEYALELDPDNIDANYFKGELEKETGNGFHRKMHLRRILDNPRNRFGDLQTKIFASKWFSENNERIEDYLKELVSRYPTSSTYAVYSRFYIEIKKDKEKSKEMMKKSLDMGPSLSGLQVKIDYLQEFESIETAISFAHEAINILPQHEIDFLYILENIYSKNKNFTKSKEIRKKISELKDKK